MVNRKIVKIGVFVPTEVQLLDMISYITSEMVSSSSSPSSTQDTTMRRLLSTTSNLMIAATHDITHPGVQPGNLDILLVPGPDPGCSWNEDVLGFLRGHAAQKETTDVLSVCTGIFMCGAAGLLEGKTVCGPRGVQDSLRRRFTGTTFVGEKYRWVRDENLWTCGGITNGNDLVAAYAKRNSKHFPGSVAEIACSMADVGDRRQVYRDGQTVFLVGFLWQLVKARFVKPEKAKVALYDCIKTWPTSEER